MSFSLFWQVVRLSLTAGWMILVLLALRPLLKKAPRRFSCLLWGLVAIRLALPFSFESRVSMVPQAAAAPQKIAQALNPGQMNWVSPAALAANPLPAAEAAAPAFSPATLIPLVWGLGIAAMLLYAAVSYFRLSRQVRLSAPAGKRVYRCDTISTPFILGIVNPKIFLPSDLDEKTAVSVLAHEQAHLRRGDHLWKPLGFLLLTIHWFNPVMWLSYVLLCRDIELACDETVIRELGCEQRADYMQALVSCSVNRRRIAACPLAFGEIGVKERVKSVMNYKKPTFWIILAAIIACIVLAVCFLTDPVASRTEQPSDPAVSNTEATPDPADTAPEEPAQPTEQDDNLSAEQEAMKDELSAAEEADNSVLDELIGKAVLDHYADAVQPGQIHVESHVVLAEDRRGTETVTVYLLVLQEIYSTDGESLTLENGSYIPTAITFSLSTSSGAVTEYWEPSDGSYSDDIRAKFPPAAAEEALQNDQAYIDDLKTASFQKALEANRSAAS